jgi:hypothetical protein
MGDIKVPNIAYLGVCERAKHLQPDSPYLWHHNILGLKDTILSMIYPFNISSYQLLLAVYDPLNFPKSRISIRKKNGKELCFINFEFTRIDMVKNRDKSTTDGFFLPGDFPAWTPVLGLLPNSVVEAPEVYDVYLEREGEEFPLGSITFGLINPIPLTEDRIAAIRSHPNAAKVVNMEIACKICNDKLKIYCALEKDDIKEGQESIWYKELPDEFKCECGKTIIGLEIIQNNIHGLLGQFIEPLAGVSFTRMYEKSALQHISNDFLKLIDNNPSEGEVHQFIDNNPTLLNQFSPHRIFNKPSIIGQRIADIAVLNTNKEFLLIELEKPGMRLLRNDGAMTAKTTHAIDQVREWLFIIDHHHAAALDCLHLEPDDLSKIKGVVIAGRESGYNKKHFQKLKWSDLGRVELLTYDDILRNLGALIRGIEGL